MTDPTQTIGSPLVDDLKSIIQNFESRIWALEHGSTGGGGGGGGGGIPAFTLTAKGDIIVATGPSAPAVLNMGTAGQVLTVDSNLGNPVGLKWSTISGGPGSLSFPITVPSGQTGFILDDRASGTNQETYDGLSPTSTEGRRYIIRDGFGSGGTGPTTDYNPTFKLSRVSEITTYGPPSLPSQVNPWYAPIYSVHKGTSANRAMMVGLSGHAINYASAANLGGGGDAVGVYGMGWSYGTGIGTGGYFQGARNTSAGGAMAMEIRAINDYPNVLVPPANRTHATWDGVSLPNDLGGKAMALWVTSSSYYGNKSAAGVVVGSSNGGAWNPSGTPPEGGGTMPFHTAFAVQQYGAYDTAFRDDSAAVNRGLWLNGKYSYDGIRVGPTSTTGTTTTTGTGSALFIASGYTNLPAPSNIANVSPANPPLITTQTAHGLQTGMLVSITGCRFTIDPNTNLTIPYTSSNISIDGTWYVQVNSTTSFYLISARTGGGSTRYDPANPTGKVTALPTAVRDTDFGSAKDPNDGELPVGQRWNMRHGTLANPVGKAGTAFPGSGASVRIDRYQALSYPNFGKWPGPEPSMASALYVRNIGTTADDSMCVAGFFETEYSGTRDTCTLFANTIIRDYPVSPSQENSGWRGLGGTALFTGVVLANKPARKVAGGGEAGIAIVGTQNQYQCLGTIPQRRAYDPEHVSGYTGYWVVAQGAGTLHGGNPANRCQPTATFTFPSTGAATTISVNSVAEWADPSDPTNAGGSTTFGGPGEIKIDAGGGNVQYVSYNAVNPTTNQFTGVTNYTPGSTIPSTALISGGISHRFTAAHHIDTAHSDSTFPQWYTGYAVGHQAIARDGDAFRDDSILAGRGLYLNGKYAIAAIHISGETNSLQSGIKWGTGGMFLHRYTLGQLMLNGTGIAGPIKYWVNSGTGATPQKAAVGFMAGNVPAWEFGKDTDRSLYLWNHDSIFGSGGAQALSLNTATGIAFAGGMGGRKATIIDDTYAGEHRNFNAGIPTAAELAGVRYSIAHGMAGGNTFADEDGSTLYVTRHQRIYAAGAQDGTIRSQLQQSVRVAGWGAGTLIVDGPTTGYFGDESGAHGGTLVIQDTSGVEQTISYTRRSTITNEFTGCSPTTPVFLTNSTVPVKQYQVIGENGATFDTTTFPFNGLINAQTNRLPARVQNVLNATEMTLKHPGFPAYPNGGGSVTVPTGTSFGNLSPVSSEHFAAIQGVTVGEIADNTQIVGGYFAAFGQGKQDALGGVLSGRMASTGIGTATGAYIAGLRTATTNNALGAEVRVDNMAPAGSHAAYNPSGFSGAMGFWITSVGTYSGSTGNRSAVGMVIGGPPSSSSGITAFEVGFAAIGDGTNAGSPIEPTAGITPIVPGGSPGGGPAFIRDDSNSYQSILIRGTHANGALVIKSTSGGFITLTPQPSTPAAPTVTGEVRLFLNSSGKLAFVKVGGGVETITSA